jgi:hypothetical protein
MGTCENQETQDWSLQHHKLVAALPQQAGLGSMKLGLVVQKLLNIE